MGRHRLLRVVCDQHDVHGEGVGYRRSSHRVSRLSRDLLCRVMACRGLTWLARRGRAESDTALLRGFTFRFCTAVCADCRPCHSSVRCGSDGSGQHGAGRRSVSAREAGFSARDRRSGRHRRLGSGSSLRRHHGAVHELALSVLDKSPRRLCDLLRDVVGVGRPEAHGREGRHGLDRRDACWRGTNSAQYRTWLAGNQPRRIDRRSAAPSPALDCSGRCRSCRLSDFSAACSQSDPRFAHLLEPESVIGEWGQSARRVLHHGGACRPWSRDTCSAPLPCRWR
jgi:hypothetical protein